MRTLVLTVAGLVLVALAAAAVWLLTLDLERYRAEIENQLEVLTGRSVAVSGGMRLTLLPDLTIALADVTVGTRGQSWLRLPEVRAVVSPASVLTLDLAIDRIRIVDPTIAVGGDGTAGSWSGGAGDTAAPLAVRVDSLEIVNGTLVWYGGPFGDQAIDRFDLIIEAKGPDGPFEMDGSFRKGDGAWRVNGAIGRLSRPDLAASVTAKTRNGSVLRASGTVRDWREDARFQGTFGVEFPRLDLLPGIGAADELASLPVSFDAVVDLSGTSALLDDIAVALGDSSVIGDVEITPGRLAGTATASRLDLDRLVPAIMAAGDSLAGEAWLRDREIAVDLSVDHALFRGETVRQFVMEARAAADRVTIGRAAAVVPGNTGISLAGELLLDGGVPVFRGPVTMESSDVRTTLAWLGLDTGSVPRDRLRRARFTADWQATPETIVLSAMDLTLDSMHVTGRVISSLAARPRVVTDLVIDELVLDAYRPAAGFDGTWTGLDLDVRSEIGTLVHDGLVASNVIVDGSLDGGEIEVRKFEAGNVAGAAVSMTGAIEPASGTFSLDYEVSTRDAGRLVREAGLEPPFDLRPFGETALTGSLRGTPSGIDVGGALRTRVASIVLDGMLTGRREDPSFDGTIAVTGEDVALAGAALGLTMPGGQGMAFSASADILGTRQDAGFALEAAVSGMTLAGNGSIQGDRLAGGTFTLRHEDLAGLAEDLGLSNHAGLDGALDIAVEVSGTVDAWNASLSRAHIGPSSLRGSIAYAPAGGRPLAAIRLEGETVVADALAGLLLDSENGIPAHGNGDLPLGILDRVDGRLELAADRLHVGPATIEDAVVEVASGGGVLELGVPSGELFGGQVRARATVRTGVPLETEFDIALANGDLESMMRAVTGGQGLSGRLHLGVRGRTAGLDGADLLGNLEGEGSWSVRRGAVRGLDFQAITPLLASPAGGAAVADRLAEATSSGTTGIVAADGAFVIDSGVVRSDNLSVIFNGAEADLDLDADLSRWWLDLAGSVLLTGRPGLPVIALAVNGPIDGADVVVDTRLLEDHLVTAAVPEPVAVETAPEVAEPEPESAGTAAVPEIGDEPSVLPILAGGGDAAADPVADEEDVLPSSGGLLDMLSGGGDAQEEGNHGSILRVLQDP